MTLQEFQNSVCRKNSKRKAKVSNSFGVYDIYKKIRKAGWQEYGIERPLKEHEFYSIIRGVNNLLKEELLHGNDIVFPSKMGKLELRRYERGVSLVNGRVHIGYPIDWAETIKLWYEDEEAKRNKTLIRDEDKYWWKVKYNKYNANYENKSFYGFQLNRFIKLALKEKIKNKQIDTLW